MGWGACGRRLLASGILFAISAPGCGDGSAMGDPLDQPSPREMFGRRFDRIVIEVDYGIGAEPFVGSAGILDDVWRILAANVERVFGPTDKVIEIPSTLAEMQELPDVSGDGFTAREILDIAERHRDMPSHANTATIYVVFLPGFLNDGEKLRPQVLGASLGDTGVIAMFKPALARVHRDNMPLLTPFVEQSALVHEFGHAIGLVKRGIPVTEPHFDTSHPGHCSRRDCVMFFANEGATDLADFISELTGAGESVLFGSSCLSDIEAIIRATN